MSMNKVEDIHILRPVISSSCRWYLDHPQGWWQTAASLSHAVSATHSWCPVVRLRDKLVNCQKLGSVRHTCSHWRRKAGSLQTCQMPARRHTSAWCPPSICWTARRHNIRPCVEEKAEKTMKQLAGQPAWCSEGGTTHHTRGLADDCEGWRVQWSTINFGFWDDDDLTIPKSLLKTQLDLQHLQKNKNW